MKGYIPSKVRVIGQHRLAVGQIYLQPVEGLAGARLWRIEDVELSTPVCAFIRELTGNFENHPNPLGLDRTWVLLDANGLALVLDLVASYNRRAPLDPEQKVYVGQSLERHAFAEGALAAQRLSPPPPEPEPVAEPQPERHLAPVPSSSEPEGLNYQQAVALQMAVVAVDGARRLFEAAAADEVLDAAANYVKARSILDPLVDESVNVLIDAGEIE